MTYVMVPDEQFDILEDDDIIERIEHTANVSVEIDYKAKTVQIKSGNSSIQRMDGAEVIRAISNGFSVEKALSISRFDRKMLEVFDISRKTRNKKELKRQKGRIIGSNGRTKELIEELSGASISVFKQKVGIIGTAEEIKIVRRALDMLVSGKPRRTVYSLLEEYQSQKNQPKLSWRENPILARKEGD